MATSIRQLDTSDSADRRDSARTAVAVTHTTIQRGERIDEARLLDLSIYGCRLAVDLSHDEDDRLLLRFAEGQPIAARVVWSDKGHIGCRFDDPIAGSLMRELIRALS